MLTVVLLKSHIKDPKLHKPTTKSIDRLDITHQCLLALLDSPVSKSGNLKIYILTVDNILIQINSLTRIPRSLIRFKGLLPLLFKNYKIKNEKNEVLMQIVKNNLKSNLMGLRIGLSKDGDVLDKGVLKGDVTVFMNADQKSEDVFELAEKSFTLSSFGLSAFVCCVKICSFYEEANGIF